MQPAGARDVFGRSLRLLARNPALVVPGLVSGALAAIAIAILAPAQPLDSNLFTRLLQSCAQLLAAIVAIAYTTGMADAAWRDGRARFSDGARAFRRDAAHVLLALLFLFAFGVMAALAAPFTLWFSFAIYAFFGLYAMAAAVVGERPGFFALRESVEIAFARPVMTLVVVAGIVAICALAAIVAELLAATPPAGPLVSEAVVAGALAYLTLVVVGEYRASR
jgi:hypothetical protein